MTNETTAITNQQVLADHSDERAEATARAGEDAGPASVAADRAAATDRRLDQERATPAEGRSRDRLRRRPRLDLPRAWT